ncbi:hypothetical protein, partial [Nocardioides sp.]|uniref:hypothetical protein n=1 Tax=Nocardioides sp. TaxID=35761 RepID=UPI002ED50BAB
MHPLIETAAATPTAMLAEVREVWRVAVSAENRLLVLAAEWADAHPLVPDDPRPDNAELDDPGPGPAADPDDPAAEWAREFDPERGIPRWSWKAGASFAAA